MSGHSHPVDQQTLTEIMGETGLRVIADELGGFVRSEAIHVIYAGRLTNIVDRPADDL